MLNGMYTLDDFQLEGKTVLCRFDMNSPLDSQTKEPRDITRIEHSLPTIKELAEKGAKLVILIHQGGDLEYQNYGSTKPHARIISERIGKPVKYIDDVCGPAACEKIKGLKNGQILMLENVRFMGEELTLFENKLKLPPQEQSRTLVVRRLAPLADLYLCDAFAAVHRSQPTLVGMEEVLPSMMGRLMEREVSALNRVLGEPERPSVFILGGAKIQDAFMIMDAVLENGSADMILATGLVANVMLVAKGVKLGQASEDVIRKKNLWEFVDQSQNILQKYGNRIMLPVDFAYSENGARKEVYFDQLPAENALTDLGSKTIAQFSEIIKAAKTIFFNGPSGMFEDAATENGTKEILEAIAKSNGFSIVGGGDSIAAINKYGVKDQIDYISTGGGALIRFLSGEELPVITALKRSAQKYN
ncbi:MAG: phosphoglycerate kinase [Desulfitobacteriaceae bacterium]|nr:phosphoglycerate kinase [Desulfitobacteriaceae bacterium]